MVKAGSPARRNATALILRSDIDMTHGEPRSLGDGFQEINYGGYRSGRASTVPGVDQSSRWIDL